MQPLGFPKLKNALFFKKRGISVSKQLVFGSLKLLFLKMGHPKGAFREKTISENAILYKNMFGKICSFAYLFYNFVILILQP
jgi:hypothetical protein